MATKIWGPQGWMTLHSISTIYPEKPTYEEMELLKKFMNLFVDTITCPDCKNHFSKIFNAYRHSNPAWYASRSQFFTFVARAHNTVNLRIDKPRIPTVAECIDTIRRNTLVTRGAIYRNTYITYLIRNWSQEYTGESFIMAQSARELYKINNEYWNSRDTGSYDFIVPESDIMTPIVPVPMRQNYFTGQQVQSSTKIPTHVRISFITKQLKLLRK